jgi:uncharacterized protein YeeX (DUF496 family)
MNKMMKKLLYAAIIAVTLVSCGKTYDITGTSNISMMDGQKLYLKVPKDAETGDLEKVDSCDVVHGEFAFSGRVDSTSWAGIYMDDQSLIPVVLESGGINVKINDTQSFIGGTPLNDKLYKFLHSFNQILNDAQALSSKHSQYIMDGMSEDSANAMIAAQSDKLDERVDELLMKYVSENFDNVLGPGIFLMVATTLYPQPVLSPWVEDVMSKATPAFKNNPFIKEYYAEAQQLQDERNGMVDTTPQIGTADPTTTGAAPAPPTPNQMAGDSTAPK